MLQFLNFCNNRLAGGQIRSLPPEYKNNGFLNAGEGWSEPSVITEIREQNTITFAGADDDQHDMCSIYA